MQADLAAPHAAEALWAAFDEHADGADVLVNNAGVVVYGRVNEVVEEDFDRLFAVNVKAVLFIIQHGLHRLRDGARIINVSSAGAYMASPMATMYTMTKGAVSTLTRTLAWDLGERHISVNAVAPGFTDTEMNSWLADPAAKAWAAAQGIGGRVGQPDDVGDIIAFLASERRPLDQRPGPRRHRRRPAGRQQDQRLTPPSNVAQVCRAACSLMCRI